MPSASYHLPSAPVMYCGSGVGRYPLVPTHCHLSPSITSWRLLQKSNMLSMSETLLVSHPERAREVREEQPKNMLSALVTLLVSQFERSPMVEIPELLENILPMSVTCEVSQLERSRAMGVVRPASMPPMLVTLLVFQPEIELRSVI